MPSEDITEMVDRFTLMIMRAAEIAVSTSGKMRLQPTTWWNEDCYQIETLKTRALRAYQRHQTIFNKVNLNRVLAMMRKTVRELPERFCFYY